MPFYLQSTGSCVNMLIQCQHARELACRVGPADFIEPVIQLVLAASCPKLSRR